MNDRIYNSRNGVIGLLLLCTFLFCGDQIRKQSEIYKELREFEPRKTEVTLEDGTVVADLDGDGDVDIRYDPRIKDEKLSVLEIAPKALKLARENGFYIDAGVLMAERMSDRRRLELTSYLTEE